MQKFCSRHCLLTFPVQPSLRCITQCSYCTHLDLCFKGENRLGFKANILTQVEMCKGEVLGDRERMGQEREGEADCVTFLSFFLFPFPHCVCCSDSRYSSCAASAQNQEHSWALNFTELDTYCNFPASQLLSAAHASIQMLASKTVGLPTERKKTVLPS